MFDGAIFDSAIFDTGPSLVIKPGGRSPRRKRDYGGRSLWPAIKGIEPR